MPKIDGGTVLAVVIGMIVFKLVDKMVLSKIEIFNLESDEDLV